MTLTPALYDRLRLLKHEGDVYGAAADARAELDELVRLELAEKHRHTRDPANPLATLEAYGITGKGHAVLESVTKAVEAAVPERKLTLKVVKP